MHRIGLTGVTGHLGNSVYEKLRELGLPCKLLVRKELKKYVQNEVVIGDLRNAETLSEFADGCTAVIHCAGMVWPRKGLNTELREINLNGTKRLFEQCKKHGVKHFVYVSSIQSMQIPFGAKTFDESAKLTTDKTLAYDFSKAEVERYLSEQEGIKITVFNPTAVIGPGDKNLRAMNQLFYLLYKGRLPMVTSGGYYVIDVRTVAEAFVNAILLGKTGKYILGGAYYSIKSLASKYAEINGLDGKRLVLPAPLMKLIAILVKPMEYYVAKPLPINTYAVSTLLNAHPDISSNLANMELDLTHIPIEKTLGDLHTWFKDELTND